MDICWSIISVSLEKNSLDIVKKCSFTRINVNAFERVTWAVTLFFQWGVQSPSRRRETPAASSSSLMTWSSLLLHHIFFRPLRIYHKRTGWLVLSFKRHRRLPLLTAGLFGKGLTKKTSHSGQQIPKVRHDACTNYHLRLFCVYSRLGTDQI